jgi:hypothetical protein
MKGDIEPLNNSFTVLKTFVKYLWPKDTGSKARVVLALSLLIGSKVFYYT